MLEEYENLSDGDKERFGRLVNMLLEHTYVFKYEYSDNSSYKQSDAFYYGRQYLDLLNEYLSVIGYQATIDNNYGILYISSFPASARARLDKLSTTLIYTLRSIYEERRGTDASVEITIGELIAQYMDCTERDKKPSNKEIGAAIRSIKNAHLIEKDKGSLESDSTKILILPSILLVLPEANILELAEEFVGDEEAISLEDDE